MNIKSARVVVILFIYKLIIGYKFIVEKRVKKFSTLYVQKKNC
jgi:hypothetical protein